MLTTQLDAVKIFSVFPSLLGTVMDHVYFLYHYYCIAYVLLSEQSNNNKIWILFAMSAYSFDEPKFTSAREKRKEKENNKQKHPKIYNA